MDTHIQGTGLVLTPEIQDYFNRQVRKIEKLVHTPAARLDAEFLHLTERNTDNEFKVELLLRGGGLDLRSEAEGGNLHGAMDEAVEQLLGELRKKKGKKLRLFRLEGLKFKNFLRGWTNRS